MNFSFSLQFLRGSIFFIIIAGFFCKDVSADTASRFIRLRLNPANNIPAALEVAIIRYQSSRPELRNVTIDLISAIHAGDRPYFLRLNRELSSYDALLYEGIVKKNARNILSGRSALDPLRLIRDLFYRFFQFEDQLDAIDYAKVNFVRADMTLEQFIESLRVNNKGLTRGLANFLFELDEDDPEQAKPDHVKPEPVEPEQMELGQETGNWIFTPKLALSIKRTIATEMANSDIEMSELGETIRKTFIIERNSIVMSVLAEQLALGKKHIGIYYGLGHMIDLEQRLKSQFDMFKISERWLIAWDLN